MNTTEFNTIKKRLNRGVTNSEIIDYIMNVFQTNDTIFKTAETDQSNLFGLLTKTAYKGKKITTLLNKFKKDELYENMSNSKKKGSFNIIIKLINNLPETNKKEINYKNKMLKLFKEKFDNVSKKITTNNKENKYTVKEINNLVNLDVLKSAIDYYKNSEKLFDIQKYIYLRLLLSEDWTPRGDLRTLQVIYNYNDDDDKNNFILITDKITIILNTYKTSNEYGKLKYTFEDNDIRDEIVNFLELREKQNIYNDYLLLTPGKKTPYKQSAFTKYGQKVFESALGKSITVDLYRKIKINEFMNRPNYNTFSENELDELHKILFQHSRYTALQHYKKING
jgi:hypothetical protein